ncbi:MAG: hypothetical protein LBI61_03725 [Puniceicoccales bacterium]|jgi:hypothetical protein|nr:hypothetical protein [Puniceicoccales bacterium]
MENNHSRISEGPGGGVNKSQSKVGSFFSYIIGCITKPFKFIYERLSGKKLKERGAKQTKLEQHEQLDNKATIQGKLNAGSESASSVEQEVASQQTPIEQNSSSTDSVSTDISRENETPGAITDTHLPLQGVQEQIASADVHAPLKNVQTLISGEPVSTDILRGTEPLDTMIEMIQNQIDNTKNMRYTCGDGVNAASNMRNSLLAKAEKNLRTLHDTLKELNKGTSIEISKEKILENTASIKKLEKTVGKMKIAKGTQETLLGLIHDAEKILLELLNKTKEKQAEKKRQEMFDRMRSLKTQTGNSWK